MAHTSPLCSETGPGVGHGWRSMSWECPKAQCKHVHIPVLENGCPSYLVPCDSFMDLKETVLQQGAKEWSQSARPNITRGGLQSII